MATTIEAKIVQPPRAPAMQPVKAQASAKLPRPTHIRFADFDAPPLPYEMATNIFANVERQPRANEVAANRPARAAAHSKRWRNDRTARLERNRFGIPAPQAKEARKHTKVANKEGTADQPLYQQQAPVPSRPSPRAQKANHEGINSRHILASTHESRCTSNGEFKYMKDDPPTPPNSPRPCPRRLNSQSRQDQENYNSAVPWACKLVSRSLRNSCRRSRSAVDTLL